MYSVRKSNLYNSKNKTSFTISRSKINLYLECPKCFYLDRVMGVGRPSMPAFSLNSAVDVLLKKEFDLLRDKKQAHELMIQYKIDAIPFAHPDLHTWRDDYYRYKGASVIHKKTNLEITGIVDDIWVNKKGELIIVDYKSTSTSKELSLEDEYKQGYKLQMEVYQWIFRQKGFDVNDTGYFVFANAGKNRKMFDGKLEFELSILSHKGDVSWVEPTIIDIKKTLDGKLPKSSANCEYCAYSDSRI